MRLREPRTDEASRAEPEREACSARDRLFGTYVDPDTTAPPKFGTGEPSRDPVLLVLGV